MPAAVLQWAGREKVQPEQKESKRRLAEELESCPGIEKRWIKKLAEFLVWSGIENISEMDYPLRVEYESYLEATPQWKKICLKTYDKVVQYQIQKQMQTISGKQKYKWQYRNQIIFLLYHPNQENVSEFEVARKSDILIWDFHKNCAEKLKRQIFGGGLHLNLDQSPMSVVAVCRKESFINAADIHWYAGIWYLERLHLPKDRINPSASKESISFLEIHNVSNRKYAQEYMKYELGITGQAVSTILKRFCAVREFIIFLEENDIYREF